MAKNCVKSYPCGMSCISKNYDCVHDLPRASDKYLNELSKETVSNQITYTFYEVRDGDWDSPDFLEYALIDRVTHMEKLLDEIPDDDRIKPYRKDEVECLKKSIALRLYMMDKERYAKPDIDLEKDPILPKAAEGLTKEIRENLEAKYPDFDTAWSHLNSGAPKTAPDLNIDKSVTDHFEEFHMGKDLYGKVANEYETITNGALTKVGGWPEQIEIKKDRAYAHEAESLLNPGTYVNKTRFKTTQFHELSHFLEYKSNKVRLLNTELRREMATGDVTTLNKILGMKAYGPGEMAYPSRFSKPYTARYYGKDGFRPSTRAQETTEVGSMGIQNLVDKESAKRMYEDDRELFYHTMSLVTEDKIF